MATMAEKKKSKAALVREMHDRGIPVPDGATVALLEERLASWISGKGWVLRRFKNHYEGHPVMRLPRDVAVWVPDSDFARDCVSSKKAMILGRLDNPEGLIVIDIGPATEEE
jgi:N-glycosylase/DNA lyase